MSLGSRLEEPSPGECGDSFRGCERYWAYCSYYTVVPEYCPQTCGVCGDSAPVSSSFNPDLASFKGFGLECEDFGFCADAGLCRLYSRMACGRYGTKAQRQFNQECRQTCGHC